MNSIADPYPVFLATLFSSCLAFAKTVSNIGAVNLPVKVFCCDGWYDPIKMTSHGRR